MWQVDIYKVTNRPVDDAANLHLKLALQQLAKQSAEQLCGLFDAFEQAG